jgi:hypothetical protein
VPPCKTNSNVIFPVGVAETEVFSGHKKFIRHLGKLIDTLEINTRHTTSSKKLGKKVTSNQEKPGH